MEKSFEIIKYTDDEYDNMKEFYSLVLFESHHFTPYHPSLKGGRFNEYDHKNFIVKDEGIIIAHVGIIKLTDFRDAYTFGMATLPSYQKCGLGKKMIDFTFDYVRKLGGMRIVAFTHRDNYKMIILGVKTGFRFFDDGVNLRIEKELYEDTN